MELIHYNWMPRFADWAIDINSEIYITNFGIQPPVKKPFPRINEINDGDVIFVKTDFLKNNYFQYKILPHLRSKVLLISGVSSFSLDNYDDILNNQYIYKWFCTNPPKKHHKIVPLPIGFEEKDRSGGEQNLLNKWLQKGRLKNKINKIYLPYHTIEYNPEREAIIKRLSKNDNVVLEQRRLPFKDYLEVLSQYRYCLCLPGSGHDTHRNYESLLVGSVPVMIQSCVQFIYDFWKLPSVFLENWSEDLSVLNGSHSFNWDSVQKFILVNTYRDLIRKIKMEILRKNELVHTN